TSVASAATDVRGVASPKTESVALRARRSRRGADGSNREIDAVGSSRDAVTGAAGLGAAVDLEVVALPSLLAVLELPAVEVVVLAVVVFLAADVVPLFLPTALLVDRLVDVVALLVVFLPLRSFWTLFVTELTCFVIEPTSPWISWVTLFASARVFPNSLDISAVMFRKSRPTLPAWAIISGGFSGPNMSSARTAMMSFSIGP